MQSDYVCLLLPYSPDVHHMIGQDELSLMKSTARLANTARGGIIDEDALYHVLKDRRIWGTGLDVFEQEPIRVDQPILSLPNVVTLPPIGSASVKTRMQMAHLAADNLVGILESAEPITPILINKVSTNG